MTVDEFGFVGRGLRSSSGVATQVVEMATAKFAPLLFAKLA